MAGFESAYVALSRMKQHVQVYTDNCQGWNACAINNAVQQPPAHDVLEPKPRLEAMNAERLFSTARELRDVAAGRAVLRQAGLAGETVRHGLLLRAKISAAVCGPAGL